MDTYYLDVGVVLLDEWMQQTTDPHDPGVFMYGDREPHCWSGPVTQTEQLREKAQFVLRKQPDGVTRGGGGTERVLNLTPRSVFAHFEKP